MKIDARSFAGFAASAAKTSRACLIYGADDGQVRDYARQVIAAIMGKNPDPMNLTELTASQLKDDPALLSDALNSFSLMGGERLVWLRDPAEGMAAEILPLVIEANPTAYLLITQGELKADSKWRKLFEKEKLLAILPCYRDEGANLQRLLAEKLKERGIQAEPEAIAILTATLGNDRGVTLQEVEKIDLYLGEERRLTAAAARDLTGDNRELGLDDICNAVAGGKPAILPALLAPLYEDGTAPIAIFRVLQSHFQKIHNLQIQVAEGTPLEQALERQRVFFKQKPLLTDQLRRWPQNKLSRAMDALLEGEKTLKTMPVPPELFCSNLLHRLALSAAGGR